MGKRRKEAGDDGQQDSLVNLDIDLDFDLSDFQLIDRMTENLGETPEPQERILRPRIGKDEILKKVMFENAEEFADQISLDPNVRTFAWVSGSFIFGDIVEALITRRRVGVKRLYITSLSISQENIDSLKNVLILMGGELEKMVLVFSGFLYSHHKYDIVPYLYGELDDPDNRVQIAFGRWHTKIITLETVHGHTVTIHGSANLPSSNSIEQLMVEVDSPLHRFNADILDEVAARFGTINHSARHRADMKYIQGREAWEIARECAKEG